MITQVITLAWMMCEAPFLGGLEGLVRVRIPARSVRKAIFGRDSIDGFFYFIYQKDTVYEIVLENYEYLCII